MSNKPNASLWTITQFTEKVFIPRKTAVRKSTVADYAQTYRSVIKRFTEFVGRDIKCREVTEEMLAGFEEWLIGQNFRKKGAAAYRQHVRRVLRLWSPEVFPATGVAGRAVLSFSDSDVLGTIENIFMEHYLPENMKITSQRTIVTYGLCFRGFSEFLGHTATLDDLTDATVGKFMRWIVEVRGNRPATAKYYGCRLKAVWNWAAKKRMVAQFPTIANLPIPENIPSCWMRDELEAAGGNATKALRHSDRRTTEKSYLDPRVCDTTPENLKLFALDAAGIGGGA